MKIRLQILLLEWSEMILLEQWLKTEEHIQNYVVKAISVEWLLHKIMDVKWRIKSERDQWTRATRNASKSRNGITHSHIPQERTAEEEEEAEEERFERIQRSSASAAPPRSPLSGWARPSGGTASVRDLGDAARTRRARSCRRRAWVTPEARPAARPPRSAYKRNVESKGNSAT